MLYVPLTKHNHLALMEGQKKPTKEESKLI